jgi:hypothetical protein
MTFSCVGLFCEDIREETAGSHTIIGVMPDNIMLARPNAEADGALVFPKMGIYVRLNLDLSYKPKGPIAARASFPAAPDISLGAIGLEDIIRAKNTVAEKGLPFVGIIFKSVISPLQIPEEGQAKVYVKLDDKEIMAAALNLSFTSGAT